MSDDLSRSSDPFAPEGVVWTRVSPRLATSRRVVASALLGVVLVAVLVLGIVVGVWWLSALGIVLPVLVAAWFWWLTGRQVAAYGYAERDEDLLVRRGVMFRTLVVVPYGRMQYVDVEAGPVERWFGIAGVQLHTASAGTDARIPGLPPEEASRLRDRLASRGQAQLAGL